jgi:hypothetical protein
MRPQLPSRSLIPRRSHHHSRHRRRSNSLIPRRKGHHPKRIRRVRRRKGLIRRGRNSRIRVDSRKARRRATRTSTDLRPWCASSRGKSARQSLP